MIDPHKKARDADRDAAVEVVEAAFADGQITRADYDLRVDRLLRAETVGELQMMVRDLQQPEGEGLAPTPVAVAEPARPARSRPSAPSVSSTGVKVVLAAVGAVVALGLVVPLVLVGRVDSAEEGVSTGAIEAVERIDLTTAKGYNQLVEEVKAKTGSTTVFSAVIYPEYAVLEVPVDEESQRSYGWYFNGGWQEWSGKGTADQERLGLDRIRGRTLAGLVDEVRGLVDDPTSSYVIVNRQGSDEGVCISAYATNEYRETAYLDARCDGTVVRTYVS